MPRNTPRTLALPQVLFEAGPFTPAETVVLTGITESTLQNWGNKGYVGADKVGLGRGAKRRYSLGDVETIMFGMDMVDAGIAPVVAFEYAPVVQQRTAEAVERIRTRLVEDRGPDADIQEALSDQVVELLACFEANPDAGTSAERVSVLHRGKMQFQHLPGGGKAVLLLRVGLRKIGLARHLDAIKVEKQLKRTQAKAERDLLKGLETLDASSQQPKGKP